MDQGIFILLLILFIITLFVLAFIIINLLMYSNNVNKRLMYMLVIKHQQDLDVRFDALFEEINMISEVADSDMMKTALKDLEDEDIDHNILDNFSPHNYDIRGLDD